MPVFEEGFAAVEGEIVILVKDDAPADKVDWTMEEAKAMVGSVHMGVEIASSPFGAINDHGPLVTISDFGNNYGVIIGEPIPEWESYRLAEWMFETYVEGECVGKASPDNIPGGPVGSLKFILENAARRGKPLKKGMAISTGAITGVHQVFVGQSSTVKCAGLSDIHVTFSALK